MWLKPHALQIGRRDATCSIHASGIATNDFIALGFNPMQSVG
jgi:hypothetical protein